MIDVAVNVFLGGLVGVLFGFFIGAKWMKDCVVNRDLETRTQVRRDREIQ